MKTLFASLVLMTLSNPTFALQYCALDLENPDGIWEQVIHAKRGEKFGDKKVNRLSDGDRCKNEGRNIGPLRCQLRHGGNGYGHQYRIRAKNKGIEKHWIEQC